MSLTKEDFKEIEQILDRKLDEKLDKKLSGFATKNDLQDTEDRIIKKVIARIDQSQEELALITKGGFDEVMEKIGKINMTKRVEKLETQMGEMRTALRLN